MELKDGSGYVVKKQHENIISYHGYGLEQNPTDFYREQLMLYFPWRDEDNELINSNQQLLYVMHCKVIPVNKKKFDVLDNEIIDRASGYAERRENKIADLVFSQAIDKEYAVYLSSVDCPDHDTLEIFGPNVDYI